MNAFSVAPFIQENYPEYWGVQRYPKDRCAVFLRTAAEWGVFSNFYQLDPPLSLGDATFGCVEELYALMKFRDREPVEALHGLKGMKLKMKSKPWQRTHRRDDWGSFFIDAMKFCLATKYEQCAAFRGELERSKGLFIVERIANPNTDTNAWNAKLEGGYWTGPNVFGRLLMELRDGGGLTYNLPEDAFAFLEFCKGQKNEA